MTKNIFSSWAGYLVRLVITFFFVPYITSVYGDARYGVWVIIFQTINYFSLLDIGLTSALTRHVSKFLSRRDFTNINRTLNTSNLLYFVVGSLVMGGIYLFVTFLFDYLKMGSADLAEEGKSALLILGAFMAFNFYLLPFGNSLSAFQRYDLSRLLAVVEELVKVAAMVWLIKNGHGLAALALVVLSVSVLRHCAGALWLKRLHSQIRFSLTLSDKQTAGILLRYSKISFGITIGWLIVFNTDTFLLGLLYSSAAAGVYNPGAQLMLWLRNIINAVGVPLTPAISHLEAANETERIREIYLKGVRYVSYVSFLLTVGVLVYARSFVDLWLPAEFSRSAEVMMILSIGNAVFLPQIIGNSVLFGIGKHRYILQVLILEATTKIVLSIVLIPRYGITGMALANAIPQLCYYLTLYPYFMARILGMSFWRVLSGGFKAALTAVVVALPTAVFARQSLPPENWTALIANIAIVGLVALVPAYFLIGSDDKEWLRRLVRKTPPENGV